MAQVKVHFDTNILIDYLAGRREAATELARHRHRVVSRIVWMEVLVGIPRSQDEEETRRFLDGFEIDELTPAIAEKAVALRRQRSLRLPDAIILATAREGGGLLVTRNTKDFDPSWPEIRVPYGA